MDISIYGELDRIFHQSFSEWGSAIHDKSCPSIWKSKKNAIKEYMNYTFIISFESFASFGVVSYFKRSLYSWPYD